MSAGNRRRLTRVVMCGLMFFQFSFVAISPVAVGAHERLFARVNPDVGHVAFAPQKPFVASFASAEEKGK